MEKNLSTKEHALKALGIYSSEEALAILDAVEKKRKNNLFAKYFTPIKSQIPIFEAFTKDIKTIGVLGGNRSGKTEAGAFIAAAWALGKDYFKDEPAWEWVKDLPIPEPPNTVWVVGLDFSVLKDVIWGEKLRVGKGHPPFIPHNDENYVTKTLDSEFRIFFANGSMIVGKSADSGRAKFQGASVDLIWIDEECESDVHDECYQRTSDCAGKILLTMTPLTDISSGVRIPWVWELYRDWQEGQKDVTFVKLSVLDNPFVPEVEKEKLKEKWAGHVEEGARLYGDFVRRAGLVYPEWDPKVHVIKPFRLPLGWRRVVSIDPAATGVTAALWGAFDPKGDLYLYREYYEKNLVASDHAKNVLAMNAGNIVDIWIMDPKYGKQRNAETHKSNWQLWKEAGINCRLPDVGLDYGLNISREYLRATKEASARMPKVFVFSGLTNFVWEIEQYMWAMFGKGEMKGLSKEKPVKKHDHLMNAYQYLTTLRLKGLRLRADSTRGLDKKQQAKINSYT